MAVPLAAAFVRLEPDTNTAAFQKAGAEAGKTAGSSYADGFYRDSAGKLRQANGQFATDAQKKMLAGGGAAGKGFGNAFNKEGGGIISKGFNSLKSELGPLLIPAGIGAAVMAIGKIGITYEDNLNILKTVSKATGDQMAQVSEKARQLGADVTLPGVSAAGAAGAMTELAKAGFTVQEAMDGAKGTLQLARVAGLAEADAAEITANAVNAFGLEAKDTSFVVDELAAAANSSSIEVSEASQSFKAAAAVFAGFQNAAVGPKEAITELNTSVAILGNNGIKGSDAGTSLKQMLLQLTGPSDKAKNSMEAIALAAGGASGALNELVIPVKGKGGKIEQIHTGLTLMDAALTGTKKQSDLALQKLAELNPQLANVGDIAYDSSGKMRPLRDTLDLLTRGLKNETEENRNAAITQIFGADASRAVLALMKGGLPVYDAQRKAVMEQGAAASVAAAKNAGLGGAIDNVKSQLENAAIGIYNSVKGPLTTSLNTLANVLSTVFTYIGNNIDTIKDWAFAIGLVTAALKINSTMLAIQGAGGILSYLKTVRIVTTTTRLWSAAQALLNATLIANPIGLVIVAIAAFVAGFVLAYKHVGWFRNAVNAAWAGIKVAISAVVSWIMDTVWPSLQRAWQSIASGAMWLWHNAIMPAWNGIKTAVTVVVSAVQTAIGFLIGVFKAVAAVAMWLWHNIFEPVFGALRKIVEIWWLAIRIPIFALYRVLQFTIGGALMVMKTVFVTVFNAVKAEALRWWGFLRSIFKFLMDHLAGPVKVALGALRTVFTNVFNAVKKVVSDWWNVYLRPVFTQVRNAWNSLAGALSAVYNDTIKPLFRRFVDFVKIDVVNGFKTAVKWIGEAWNKVKDAAKVPVAFVVNSVINPFIGGLNAAAKIVGINDRVEPIKGFAEGGQIPGRNIPGYANGGRIAGMRAAQDNRTAMVSGLGPVKLMGGEFVVNARDTMKALPLLKWINSGMKRGGAHVARMIGRPMTSTPGDGSEGWAFKDGGLIGWVKDIWGAVSNPIDTIKKPFEAALGKIPGAGMVRDWLIGSARKLVGGAIDWITGGGSFTGTASGNVGKAQSFVRAQNGKPYVWASAGPRGYDCSGIVSAVYNLMHGKSPYSHTFSTGGLPGHWFNEARKVGPLLAGWSHPGQAPAGPSVGHMAGQIGGLPFESRGSKGVVVGAAARRIHQFAHIGAAYANGGKIPVFDAGGTLAPGFNTVYNGLGRPEPLRRADTPQEVHLHFHAPVGDRRAAADLVYGAWKDLKKDGRIR